MQGDFCSQKLDIPGTAYGREHAGEQEIKKLKVKGGLTGITASENSIQGIF